MTQQLIINIAEYYMEFHIREDKMSSYTKMRIIHDVTSNAEKEYLKTFFNYIGIVVYDEAIYQPNDWRHHLEKLNDSDGVDIVLNYYGVDYFKCNYRKRIYLYFDLDNNICEITELPLTNLIDLSEKENTSSTKKDLRIQALNLLINEIWKTDEKNRMAIQNIRNCYVPQNEDKDLFYILQAINSCMTILKSYTIEHGNQGDEVKHLPLVLNVDYYVNIMLNELCRMQYLLSEDDSNPYISYVDLYNMELLSRLYPFLSYYVQLSIYREKSFIKNPTLLDDLFFDIKNKFPWFTKLRLRLINYVDFESGDFHRAYKKLINDSENSEFPAYYSNLYVQIARTYLSYPDERYEQKLLKLLKKYLEIDPANYQLSYYLSYLYALKGKFEYAETILYERHNILAGFESTNCMEFYYASLNDIFNEFESQLLLAGIAIDSSKEYSLMGYVSGATVCALEFENARLIKKVADPTESSYQEFMQYHEYSTPLLDLYLRAGDYAKLVYDGHEGKRTIQMKLKRWGRSL